MKYRGAERALISIEHEYIGDTEWRQPMMMKLEVRAGSCQAQAQQEHCLLNDFPDTSPGPWFD
jgi:hypothetical protein